MLLKVVGVARLTRDVELRYLNNGSPVAKLGLACSKKYKTQAGVQKEDICFIDGTVFGKLGEVANTYLKKGSKIYVDADLKFEQWEDQQGQNRSKHTLQINTFEMLDSKSDNQGQGSSQGYNQNPPIDNQTNHQYTPTPEQQIPSIDIDDESIPF